MTDIIGRAILENVIDSTGAKVGAAEGVAAAQRLEKATTDAAKGMSDAQKQQQQQQEQSTTAMSRASQNLLRQIERESQQAGRTRSEYLSLRAAQAGLTDQAAPLIARLKEQEAAAKRAGTVFNEYGLSAKQTTAALRQVPAQITDIVVSLQGGQAPLTVLLQQGGQLRDVFGGAVPAFKALAGVVLSAINPTTILAAGLATAGAGYFLASQEADRYTKSLTLSNGTTGLTVAQLQMLAAGIDNVVGTQANAADALSTLAQTGRLSYGSLESAAIASIRTQRLLGISIEDTSKRYAELAKEPVDALRKLQDETGRVSFATFEQVRALQESGRNAEAAAVAQAELTRILNQQASEVEAGQGIFQRAFRGTIDVVKELGDAIVDAFRPVTQGDQLAAVRQILADRQAGGLRGLRASVFGPSEEELRRREAVLESDIRQGRKLADEDAARARRTTEAIAAEKELTKTREGLASKTDRATSAVEKYRKSLESIRAVNPNSELLPSPSAQRAEEARIRANIIGKAPRQREVRDDEATRLLIRLRETEASLQGQLVSEEKLGAAAKERIKFEAEIAALKEKKILTSDQKSLLAAEGALLSQLRKNEAIEKEVMAREAATKEAERLKRLEDAQIQRSETLRQSIADRAVARAEAQQRVLGAFGRGDVANQRVDAENDVRSRALGEELRLTRSTPLELRDSARYLEDLAIIRQARDAELQQLTEFYAQYDAKQGDFVNGATRALENYLTQVRDIAGQTDQLFSNAFQTAEDALVKFTMTGKLSFSDLANSIIADINRMIIKQQILGPLAQSLGLSVPAGAAGGPQAGGSFSFGNLIGSGLNALFGRANGGPVMAGGMYRVNENRPELLNIQGKQYLMMGNQSGTVDPNKSPRGGTVINNTTINVPQTTSRQSGTQLAADFQRKLAQGARNN